MGDRTSIEWTRGPDGRPGATWNPIRARNRKTGKTGWHCVHKTEACRHCYAEAFNLRLGTRLPFKPGHLSEDVELFLDEKILIEPLRWREPRTVFPCSMTDLAADFVPDDWLDRMFAVMALADRHRFTPLTKRPGRMRQYLTADNRRLHIAQAGAGLGDLWYGGWLKPWPLPNVFPGFSAHDQESFDASWGAMREPALAGWAVWCSLEPLLGPVRVLGALMEGTDPGACANCGRGHGFTRCPNYGGVSRERSGRDHCHAFRRKNFALRGIVVGGESGTWRVPIRPMHPAWARKIRDDCDAAGVPFHFKQWGGWRLHATPACGIPVALDGRVLDRRTGGEALQAAASMIRVGKKAAGRDLDGRTHDETPWSSPA